MPDDWNAKIIEEFRANEGRVGGPFEGAPMVLLTTTGARSGRAHTTPLVPLVEDDRVYVFASMGGAPKHPAWYFNLLAHSEVTVERGTERYSAKATVITGGERERVFARQVALRPQFGEYQQKTKRRIPVVELKRLG